MAKKQIKLIRVFQIIAVGALVLLAAALMTVHLLASADEFSQRSETMRADYIAQQKDLIKREVMRAVTLIRDRRSHALEMTRESVKERTNEVFEIVKNIYAQNKNTESDKEIQQLILAALRPVRYANGSGYYFITRLDGTEVLFPDKPELEGTNLLHVQDSQGKFVVRDMIDLVRQAGEGFYQYHWSKPQEKGENHKKISYVKFFEPYQWIIGTGLYLEDFDNMIKQNVLKALSQVRFGDNGYLFINKLNGDTLVTNGKVISGTKKIWEVFNKAPIKAKTIFAQQTKAASKPAGDFIYYSTGKLTEPGKKFPKASFVYGLPELQWLIGAGVYLDEVENHIAALQLSLDKHRHAQIKETLFITALFVIVVLFLFYVVSRFLNRDMEAFVNFFNRAAYKGEEIDSDKIYFYGLSKIAESANAVLRDRQKALEQIKLSEEKYRNLFESSVAGLFRTRPSDGLLLDANARVLKVLGFTVDEAVGKLKVVDLFANISDRKNLLARLAAKGYVDDYEVDFILPDGQKRSYSFSMQLYPEKDLIEGVVVDITKRKEAETLLRESEERFRDLAELLPEAVFETDINLKLTYANQQALDIFGYSEVGFPETMSCANVFHPEEMEKLLANIELQFQGEKTERTEYRCIRNDGTVFPALFRVCPIMKEGQPAGVRGVVIDLTEQKKAASLLEESEERFRTLAEMLPEAVFETDINMTMTYGNKRAFELYGYTKEDYSQGLNGLDMFVPEERQNVLQNTAAQFRGEKRHSTEYRSVRKDGTVFPALFHVSPIFKEGQPFGLRGVIVDLTEHKKAEDEILKLRKLESVGILAGGIAHDFNNLLAGLFGNIEMAKRSLADDHKAHKYLESAGVSMERATGLTQQLLTFAKGGDPIKEVLSLEGVIAETARFSLRGSNVKLRLDLAEDLWLVDADKGQLSQVVSNLVINGKQAMPGGGEITITAENIETAQGRQVQICVQDQGIGIAPQHLDKIFDPYFSTKQQGSGLGLALCYSIITKHNGTITVTSELNKGTCFTIILPVADQHPEVDEVVAEPQVVDSGVAARILILDDEELIQQMAGAMLQEMGHQVDYAAHGEEAIAMWQRARDAGNEYDVVICDLTIPGGMGGQEAAAEISRIDPAAKLIVSSGYATDPVVANYVDYGFKGRIAKPYRFDELQEEVARVFKLT